MSIFSAANIYEVILANIEFSATYALNVSVEIYCYYITKINLINASLFFVVNKFF